MKTRTILGIVITGVILSVFAQSVFAADAQIRLKLSPNQQTTYKVATESLKDYLFVQSSEESKKERHTIWQTEIVFTQKIDSVDKKGNAVADITIKKLKYLSQDPDGKKLDFDSTSEKAKSDPLFALIGQSYKITLTPEGKVKDIIAKTARQAVIVEGSSQKIAARLLSDDEITKRHQVPALFDVNQCLSEKERELAAKAAASGKKPAKVNKKKCKIGDSWSMIAAAPEGMLRQRSFDKIYTLSDIKDEKVGSKSIKTAVIDMNAAPSSKHAEPEEKESAASFFANMFDETYDYNGKLVLNLSTGEIDNYRETLKAEWKAEEPPKEKESTKVPDQLTMGFSNMYSIEKVKD